MGFLKEIFDKPVIRGKLRADSIRMADEKPATESAGATTSASVPTDRQVTKSVDEQGPAATTTATVVPVAIPPSRKQIVKLVERDADGNITRIIEREEEVP